MLRVMPRPSMMAYRMKEGRATWFSSAVAEWLDMSRHASLELSKDVKSGERLSDNGCGKLPACLTIRQLVMVNRCIPISTSHQQHSSKHC